MILNDEKTDYNPLNLPIDFVKYYGGNIDEVKIFAGPARINIIGEHIDYNGGKVFPAAINKYIYIAIRKTSDTKITYNDLKFPGSYSFDINDDFKFSKENNYANYLNGIISIIKRRGYVLKCGFQILIVSNIPAAGGISSSSALECTFAFALSETFNLEIPRKEIAIIGQQSEHEFMNVKCGIMDQYIIATAKVNTAEVLDCAKIEHEYIPLELGDYRFVIMNSKKKRQLADSKYNERREQCEKGLEIIRKISSKIKDSAILNYDNLENLCSLTMEQFLSICNYIDDEVILKRVRHCVTENQRVKDAVEALKKSDLIKLGQLLCESHKS
ncbi:MAG: galactokinase, partial [Treponema sp.]|uniref:galactokinase n=1 Tax=Treponema sp. TaxID=166 RepID=UPI00298EC1FB